MYKIYWSKLHSVSTFITEGKHWKESRAEWDQAPLTGLQLLSIKLDKEEKGRSRVLWYQDGRYRRILGDVAFYGWVPRDPHPTQFTPDAVLDLWHQKTGRTDTKLIDLSLDDYASLHVKLGRSVDDETFAKILKMAVEDADIP